VAEHEHSTVRAEGIEMIRAAKAPEGAIVAIVVVGKPGDAVVIRTGVG